MTGVTLVSRGVYAKQHDVSKTAVGKWEKRGILVVVDGKVHVEASDRRAAHAGVGRYGSRPVPQPSGDGLPPAALLLRQFVNRTAAHGALTAWEVGVSLEHAKQIDTLYRVVIMDAVAELLTDMQSIPPAGSPDWDECPMWDADQMAQIDWSAVSGKARDAQG